MAGCALPSTGRETPDSSRGTRVAVETGSVVRRLRLRAGLTQEELAERSGVSVRTIRGIETGSRRNPQLVSLVQLADALELSADERHDLLGALGAAAPSVTAR